MTTMSAGPWTAHFASLAFSTVPLLKIIFFPVFVAGLCLSSVGLHGVVEADGIVEAVRSVRRLPLLLRL